MADLVDEAVVSSGDGVDEFKMPSTEELLAAVDKMSGLTEDMKKELVDGILARGRGEDPLTAGDGGGHVDVAVRSASLEIIWILALISLILLVLVFFGYKLYKSLVDRERRREEKKRQKLQKKKK